MIIEKSQGETLVKCRPYFLDKRTGVKDTADFFVSLFPSEIKIKEDQASTKNIIVTFVPESEVQS